MIANILFLSLTRFHQVFIALNTFGIFFTFFFFVSKWAQHKSLSFEENNLFDIHCDIFHKYNQFKAIIKKANIIT